MNAREQRYREVRKVTLIGSAVDLCLGIAKILVGWLAHSQALIADGIHSLSDLITDFIVLYAAKHSHKAPDANHPYGHGRIETLATVALGIFLIIIAAGIAYNAVLRLNEPDMWLEPGWVALVVAIISIFSKEWVYRFTIKAARQLRSEMLMANAWHSRSDAISSIVVVIGIAGAMYGYPYLDAVAAVAVAVIIAKIGFNLIRSNSKELIDTALEPEEVEIIRRHIFKVDGVNAAHMLRSRKSAGNAFVDVHIQVDPYLSVSEGHQIGEMVRRRLLDEVEMVTDVTIHIDPENDESGSSSDNLPTREKVMNELKQCWQHLPTEIIENVTLHYLSGEIQIELDLPIKILKDIGEAKPVVIKLKQAVSTLSYISNVEVRFTV
jgi:cation diffusion facilitator family transporter